MASDTSILLKVSADTRQAVKSINDFQKSSSKSLESIESSFGTLKVAVLALAGAFGAIKIADFLGQAASSAAEAEVAFDQMAISLKLSGDFSEQAANDFSKLASSIQEATGISDELILSQVSYAKSLGLSNDETTKLINAAKDFSAATGQDFASSVRTIGQTLDGTAGRLKETIPALRQFTEEQLKSGAAIDFVAGRFKGAADALGGTFSGQVARARANFGELVETLGTFITQNEIVIQTIQFISNGFVELNKIVQNNRTAILEFIKSIIVFAGNSITFIAAFVSTLDKIFADMRITFLALVESIRTIPDRIFAIGRAIKTFSLKPIQDEDKKLLTTILNNTGDILTPLSERQKAYESIGVTIAEMTQAIEKSDAKTIQSTKRASDAIRNQTKAVQELSAAERQKQLDQIAKGAGSLASAFSQGGAAGGKALLGAGANAAGTAFGGPAAGAAAQELFNLLALGPEAVKAQVKSTIESIPQIIGAVLEALPELIITIVETFPDLVINLITTIIDKLPVIIERLVVGLIQAAPRLITELALRMPEVAFHLVTGIIQNLPSMFVHFVKALVDAAGKFVEALLDKVSGGIGGAIFGGESGGLFGGGGFLGLGLAQGGLVPEGFNNDTFPARLSSGELVIPRQQNDKLQEFLNAKESRVSASSQAPTGPMIINLKVGERELASVLFDLNQAGFRTA